MDFIPLISAFGVGAIVSAVIQSILTSRLQGKRDAYSERKEAYIGLWEAIAKQEINSFPKGSDYEVGHWVLRCELVASKDVFNKLEQWCDEEPGSESRKIATKALKAAMRNDLGVSNYKL